MLKINDSFTSTGQKFFHHREALEGLRTNKPRPVVSHIMLTDTCQHTCAFCSVQTREGNSLTSNQIIGYLETLNGLGLKSVILSGGGNPLLFKEKRETLPNGELQAGRMWDFNDAVDFIHGMGLEIGLITNGMPLVDHTHDWQWGDHHCCTKCGHQGHHEKWCYEAQKFIGRKTWKGVRPSTLDKLTWVRISMSGLDHKENTVYVPDIDRTKTTLGFSYVFHDIYEAPSEPNHGKVSTRFDLDQFGGIAKTERLAEDRFEELTKQIGDIVEKYKPSYVRGLPNCLEPEKIQARCERLQEMANKIDPSVFFVQYKPPEAPSACYLGYLHPVLNSDGWVFACDSCVLNKTAGHKFAEPWRLCRWDEIESLYSQPVRSLIKDPKTLCPGCVFTKSNNLLIEIKNGMPIPTPEPVQHPNFV